ncbi:AAA family ATPase [Amycolatopsis sp., V23-08]|uniref:AAA family ATPase n=1 Tax=Amycolatopsis heterodermiae TaxID=3110235 RepID=A0ABU5R2N0_9PSEU|nr:AAA family ATPase [Amycolatopsis sp., V23-08]MEA5360461.1 AAA family ATPase [Amycolatopsis sp., V23-08]
MEYRSLIVVGRSEELRVVDDALSAARDGRGGAVFVVGESGIGKSRLITEGIELANAAGMALLRGRASAIGPSVSFRPFTEAILHLLRTEPVEPSALGSYATVLGRLVPEWCDPPAGPAVESPVTLGEAVLRLTGVAGQGRGCLLALDDLHDADTASLALLEYLIDNVDRQPTLLLCGLRETDGAALALVRDAAQRGRGRLLEPARLTRADLRALVGARLDTGPETVPAEALELVWAGSAGNPFLAEEVVSALVQEKVVVREGPLWVLPDRADPVLPPALARPLATRIAGLDERTRDVLSAAVLFGSRFPLAVLARATGLTEDDVVGLLRDDPAGSLVEPEDAGWYAFRHPLGRAAVLAQLGDDDRIRLAARAADAVDSVHPGLPGEWCELAATLRLAAGQRPAAGRLFAESGRRALDRGASTAAVALLSQAWELLAGDPASRADALEQLLLALAEDGLVDRALSSVAALDRFEGLTPARRAVLHTRLAWALEVAGRVDEALAQVDTARALLGPDAAAADVAVIDVVAAHLAYDQPGPDRRPAAEALARRAATVAESVPLPVVACQAWLLLAAIARQRDAAEATAHLEHAHSLAVLHRLPLWELHALVRLGNDDALRTGDLTRLNRAREQASAAGSVTARYQAEAGLALHAILRGELAEATELLDDALDATIRFRQAETTRYVLLLRVVLAGHRGDRAALTEALTEFGRRRGDVTLHAPRIHGLAGAFCALLEEDHARAREDLALAAHHEEAGGDIDHLSGRFGLHLLLRVVDGTAGRPEWRAVHADPAAALRWDRQFAEFARAVLLGREGKRRQAERAMVEALRIAEPYATSRHLALRLVGEAALDDGWGDPVGWLRAAERYFHRGKVPAVARACRALLRRTGARVPQHRAGTDDIPARLRSAGVTAREYEVLGLLAGRLNNQEIAARLHLSPRTVERHVGNLITKTGLPNRIALSALALDVLGPGEPSLHSTMLDLVQETAADDTFA